jgi:hypothetical protein
VTSPDKVSFQDESIIFQAISYLLLKVIDGGVPGKEQQCPPKN